MVQVSLVHVSVFDMDFGHSVSWRNVKVSVVQGV